MSDLYIQGVATSFDQPFVHNGEVVVNRAGCFDKFLSSDHNIKLLINHDENQRLGTSQKRLLIHAGAKSLVFRYALPMSGEHHKFFAGIAGDVETYCAVSRIHPLALSITHIFSSQSGAQCDVGEAG